MFDSRFIHRRMQFGDGQGFGWINLAQLDGAVLALDWVVGEAHRIWGNAVMVAPGVALTARHVVQTMREKGFMEEGGGYLRGWGLQKEMKVAWTADGLTSDNGDLAILTLTPATEPCFPVYLATLVAREPCVGERITLVGFAASEAEFGNNRDAGLGLFVSGGNVIDVYREGRDQRLPNPSIGVAAKTQNGMSGGAAFDSKGRLIGIITSGVGDDCSFVSLSWPSVAASLEISWPRGLIEGPVSLLGMAHRGLCHIEDIGSLRLGIDGDGQPLVGLVL